MPTQRLLNRHTCWLFHHATPRLYLLVLVLHDNGEVSLEICHAKVKPKLFFLYTVCLSFFESQKRPMKWSIVPSLILTLQIRAHTNKSYMDLWHICKKLNLKFKFYIVIVNLILTVYTLKLIPYIFTIIKFV